MKTAVEELIDFLEQNQYFIGNDLYHEFARVKELGRQQIIDAVQDNLKDEGRFCGNYDQAMEEAIEYFNKTYTEWK